MNMATYIPPRNVYSTTNNLATMNQSMNITPTQYSVQQPTINQNTVSSTMNTGYNQQISPTQFQYTPTNSMYSNATQMQMPHPFPQHIDQFTQRLEEHKKHWDDIVAKTPAIQDLFIDTNNVKSSQDAAT
uniref:AP2-like ethylene-responsive transcription factor BBM1 n=1 Tax=Lygus hesperus TaxID=30085 RepID=A0A0A9XS03_LYGHE